MAFAGDAEAGDSPNGAPTMAPFGAAPAAQPFGFVDTPAHNYDAGGMPAGPMGGGMGGAMNYNDDEEPPLLEELGINFSHIKSKTMAVMAPTKELSQETLEDTDFAGPLVFCLALGFCMLLTGKLHFGYIYGLFAVGCIATYVVLNLMGGNNQKSIDVMRVFSIQGYCLLPIVILAAIHVFIDMRGIVGAILSLLVIGWSSFTSTRFFEKALDMADHRYLIAYPVFLQYACFVLITVF